ncbi:hypothetical protein MSLAZ_2873 [Methanosarcina lacustris Z-7289]|uniref:Glycosyltransferase RgtA/B/C/D-like domain-containing protein n=1 Tax=Methanosarcina lacustris Z-7289 TaxID=1434111 RepID=A0A0E3S4V7_9EURY|nr:hypothetical protein [Methanosarcina lacustris]AKB76134.1 hypothetical protein MSLAZ_2873 [Methanosarcina lacustris Z-7289]
MDNSRLMKVISFLFPLAIIFAVILTFVWMFATEKPGYAVRGLFTGIPAVLACLFVLYIYKKDVSLHDIDSFPSISIKSLTYMFSIFYIGSIVVLLLSHGGRPWYYFVFILVMYLSVFLQILSKEVKPSLVLLESFLIMLNLTYSVTLNYDFYFGTTDILPHIFLSEFTAATGQTISTALSDYAFFPLYHILIAEAAEILNLSVKTSLFLITAPIYAVTVVFLYYLFNYITHNRQISLLSCLLYSSSYIVLYYSANVITRTMAFVGFILLLYLVYSVNFKEDKFSFKALSVIVLIFMTLVHNVSILQFVLLLVILFTSEYIIGAGSYISKPFFLLLNVSYTTYWFFAAYLFMQRGLTPRLQSHFWDSIVLTTGGADILAESLTSLMGLLDKSVFLFFALIGIGFLLKNYRKNYASVFGLFALFTLLFYIPNPLNTIWQFKVLFRVDRFMLFVSPFMAFAMGYGIYVFWNYMEKYGPKKFNTVVFIVLMFSTFVFISSVFSISDSNMLGEISKHEYFTANELSGFEHVYKYIPEGSAVYSDYYTTRFFYLPSIPANSSGMNLSIYDNYRIDNASKVSNYRGYIVFRTQEFLRNGLYFGSDESSTKESDNYLYRNTPENVIELETNLRKANKIYSNPAEDIFAPGPALSKPLKSSNNSTLTGI